MNYLSPRNVRTIMPTMVSEHKNEAERLHTLLQLNILDTAPDPAFDSLVELVSNVFSVPMVAISLVAAERQWFKARVGLAVCETPRNVSFCTYAIASDSELIVTDALNDERFAQNPLVTAEPFIRSYAGVPLRMANNHAIGTLCIIDTKPREFSNNELTLLRQFGQQAQALIQFHATQQDIHSQSKKTAQIANQLDYEQSVLNAVIDASSDPIFVRHKDGEYLIVNQASVAAVDSTDIATAKHRLKALLPTATIAQLQHADNQVISTGEPQTIHCTLTDGRIFEVTKSPLKSGKGECHAVVNIARDVTQIIKSSNKAAEQSKLLSVLVHGLTDFQALMSGNQLWDFLREALRELTDSDYALIGEIIQTNNGNDALKIHSITDLAWNDESRALMQALRSGDMVLENPKTLLGQVFAKKTIIATNDLQNDKRRGGYPEGHPVLHNYLGVPIFDGEQVIGMYAISNRSAAITDELIEHLKPFTATCSLLIKLYRSMAERERIMRDLEQARDQQILANRAKTEFLSSMSHELRTPLNSILGFSQLLLNNQNQLSERQTRQVTQIEKSGRHLLSLINEVLDLAKIEAGKIHVSIEPIALNEAIKDSVEGIESIATLHDIRIVVDNETLAGIEVAADYTRLKQVLNNLLSNAIKYNRPGGNVRISGELVATPNDNLQFSIHVQDTGYGIDNKRLHEVFEPFNRLDAEQSGIEGTGVGLALTKKLIEHMNGSIGLTSTVDVGSVFSLTLPLVRHCPRTEETEIAVSENAENAENTQAPTATSLVLYIEDNPANQRLMIDVFEDLPHLELHCAHDAYIGIDIARANQPALIIMDIHLPGMNGFEALDVLQTDKQTKHIPVIALSANAMPSDVKKGDAAGFTHYLTKPVNVNELITVLNSLIKD